MSMYLYHYFDKRSGPFKSLTALSKDEAFSVLEKIKSDRPSSLTAQRDTGYISKRMNCERIVRQEALNKGILMDISSPHKDPDRGIRYAKDLVYLRRFDAYVQPACQGWKGIPEEGI